MYSGHEPAPHAHRGHLHNVTTLIQPVLETSLILLAMQSIGTCTTCTTTVCLGVSGHLELPAGLTGKGKKGANNPK